MRTIIALLIAIGLNTSLCTGGLLAVSSNIAQQISYASITTGPMSYGSIGVLSCKRSKKTVTEVGSMDQSSCDDADMCLSQTHTRIREKIAFALKTVVTPPSILCASQPNKWLAIAGFSRPSRDGPLYNQAPLLAHSLIKLE